MCPISALWVGDNAESILLGHNDPDKNHGTLGCRIEKMASVCVKGNFPVQMSLASS